MALIEPRGLLQHEGQRHVELLGQLIPIINLWVVGYDAPQPAVLVHVPVDLGRIGKVSSGEGAPDDNIVVDAARRG